MKPQTLTLDSEIFEEFKMALESSIRGTIRQMIEQKVRGGAITAKVEIKLHEQTNDDTGEIFYIPDIESQVSIKVGSKGDFKAKKQGNFIMKPDNYGNYVIASNQISIDEFMKDQKGA